MMKRMGLLCLLSGAWFVDATHATAQVTCSATADPYVRSCKGIVDHLINRHYLLYVPPRARELGRNVPLILDFHGMASSAVSQTTTSCWKSLAAEQGFVVAYPDGSGLPNSFSAGTCCGVAPVGGRDDEKFARDVVKDVVARLAVENTRVLIDPARIYASGWSNGGKMAHHLACKASNVFKGAAAMSQSYSLPAGQTCTGTPVPVIEFRGAGDTIVPYAINLPSSLSAEASMERWGADLSCSEDADGSYRAVEYPAVRVSGDPSSAYCLEYQGCKAGLAQCTLNSGHNVYKNTDNAELCRTSWAFWASHPAPAANVLGSTAQPQ